MQASGVTPVEQNALKEQAAVLYSLEGCPECPEAALAHFRASASAAAALAELRYTAPPAWRASCAAFVAANGLDAGGARELARAVGDLQRNRKGTASHFEPTPGDALAAKLWHDAGEVPRGGLGGAGRAAAVAAIVARGLAAATSDPARARLRARLAEASPAPSGGAGAAGGGGGGGGADGDGVARVQVIRLESEEAAFRPVALFPSLADATPAAVARAPACAPRGIFGEFSIPGGGGGASLSSAAATSWVALPAWAKLAPADPFAVAVPDTRALAAVAALRQGGGPALLVFDRSPAAVAPAALSPAHFYLVARESAVLLAGGGGGGRAAVRMELQPGASLLAAPSAPAGGGRGGATVVARLLLACRPPPPPAVRLPQGLADLGDSADDAAAAAPGGGANEGEEAEED